jgi:hypothetical protein
MMTIGRTLWATMLVAFGTGSASGFAPDGCEQQRAQYPANWNDTSQEKPLFTCAGPHAQIYRIKIGVTDAAGRSMMSLVPLSRPNLSEEKLGVLRIWLDKEQAQRLREGKYFGTVVRKEESCWIRGSLDGDTVFFMDNAFPPADEPDKAGSFYNKAPRFSAFGSDYYRCEPVK